MTLLELISKSQGIVQPLTTPPDYPIVLDPDSIFPSLNPKVDDPNALSLVTPITGWNISESESKLIDNCKNFFTKLKRKLKNPNSFGREEFVSILNSYLEKIREKVGISVGVDSTDDGYTRVLLDKVGSLMGKDVAGLVLEACVTFEIWELVETLIVNGLIGNSCYAYLVPRLVAKKRSDLVCQCIKHASDLGSSELLLILKYFLGSQKNACNNIISVRKEWENQALLAVEKATDKSLSGKKSSVAKEAAILLMMAHDGFSSSELCLHYMLSSENLDEVVFSSSVSKLNGEEMMGLITYLGKWLKKYERFPQVGPCPKASTSLGLKACDWVPKLEGVVKCLGLVLDVNFSSLVLNPEFHQDLMSMNEVVNSLALESKLCCSVATVAEKLRIEV
ncbi:hypothetical protein FNV43_RR20533 [Rhamnella rubrinervis]|uniref:Uncharacterized protein n=1 Tax=Rhamnella rubrinervis TaxID=2594499 RepID=A0A8K0DUK4_9ROSA|nr:hypothetical protein FNV43_RR20533 [Rhamnella rubrinervis]